MKVDEKALQEAAAKLRKLRLTDVGGRKEHPADTVKSVFETGLGGMYDDEAITYALRAGVRYYLEAAEHRMQSDSATPSPKEGTIVAYQDLHDGLGWRKPPSA